MKAEKLVSQRVGCQIEQANLVANRQARARVVDLLNVEICFLQQCRQGHARLPQPRAREPRDDAGRPRQIPEASSRYLPHAHALTPAKSP